LRYGRQYFREISGSGIGFGYPFDGRCTLGYSRILDTEEVLVALNLDADTRSDYITLDHNLTPPGTRLTDVLHPQHHYTVEDRGGRSAVRVPLPGHTAAILAHLP